MTLRAFRHVARCDHKSDDPTCDSVTRAESAIVMGAIPYTYILVSYEAGLSVL